MGRGGYVTPLPGLRGHQVRTARQNLGQRASGHSCGGKRRRAGNSPHKLEDNEVHGNPLAHRKSAEEMNEADFLGSTGELHV